MKSSTYQFHVKKKILADFQICKSVPLRIIYATVFMERVNGFTKITRSWMQEYVILYVLKLKKMKIFIHIISLWIIAINKKNIGAIADNKLNFKIQINKLCRKAFQKIATSSRLSSHINNFETKIIFNLVIKS